MRVNSLTLGFIASRFLSGALATPLTTIGDKEGGIMMESHGWLVPVDIPEEQFDESAPWMVPVLDPINRDANESIFDADGFDLVPRRAAAVEAKQALEGRATGRFWFGRRQVDMGCGETVSSIRGALGEAVYALCKDGLCDAGEGVKYVRKISWMGGGSRRITRYLEITSMGTYTGDATLGNMHNLVKYSVTSDSVKWAWRSIIYPIDNWVIEEKCKMAKFPNYIRIDKPSPNKVDVQFWIRLNIIEADCLETKIYALIAGGANGILGAAFGFFEMLCASKH